MLSRLKAFNALLPYIRENTGLLLLGAVMLIAANYLDVKALTLLGQGIDLLAVNLGPFAGIHEGLMVGFVATVAVLVVAAAIARFWMRWLIIGASRQIEFRYRDDLFRHLQSLSASFFSRYPTGDIMSRSTNDLESVRLVIGPAVMYLSGTAVMLPMSLYQMIQISGTLTLFTWLPLVLVAPLFYFFSRRIHVRSMRSQEIFSEISTRVQETLTGIRVIKAYAREDEAAKQFEGTSNEFVRESVALALLQAYFIPLMAFIISLSLLGLVWAGGVLIVLHKDEPSGLTPGNLIGFLVLLMANIWPLAAIGWVFSMVERGSASMERLNRIFAEQTEITDPPVSKEEKNVRGRIELRNLTFTYPGAHKPALREINLNVAEGQIIGLTGPVGCGKSTLAHLLSRRYNPERGMIVIDDRDILDWRLRDYRARVGIVDQEPFLFSESIASNIAYGCPGAEQSKITHAAQIAQFDADVREFPHQYETLLGERGINLSGGQRQRAALARAIAIDPAILILDDALAAVDTHTEEEILKGLREFMRGRTTLLISHRISTVSLADHILYMENGSIAESGTHEDLIEHSGHYAALARRQQLTEEIEGLEE